MARKALHKSRKSQASPERELDDDMVGKLSLLAGMPSPPTADSPRSKPKEYRKEERRGTVKGRKKGHAKDKHKRDKMSIVTPSGIIFMDSFLSSWVTPEETSMFTRRSRASNKMGFSPSSSNAAGTPISKAPIESQEEGKKRLPSRPVNIGEKSHLKELSELDEVGQVTTEEYSLSSMTSIQQKSQEEVTYFSADEVAKHNTSFDLWISLLGKVYDLTPLFLENPQNPFLQPILENAGRDLSHWFDPDTGQPRTHIDPDTYWRVQYLPEGQYVDSTCSYPSNEFKNTPFLPWWNNSTKYVIGFLSKKTRKVKVINALTSQEVVLQVCSEDTISNIQTRYMKYNKNAVGYIWTYDGKLLTMNKTLEENGIEDEQEKFLDLGLPADYYIPGIIIYFKDNLQINEFC